MLKAEICLAWLIFSCGQVMFWWRRDNVFGYLQAGFFFASIFVPLFGTSIIADLDPEFVNQYADIMVIGAFAYLLGLCYGAWLAQRLRLPPLNLGRHLDPLIDVLLKRTRRVAMGGLILLAASFALLGYVPFFAADLISAKYGVGLYQAGYARGALVLHVALIISSTVLPVMLALVVRHRRPFDAVVAGALLVGLTLSLSRGRAFIGPLVFLVALAIERGWRPWRILSAVCFAFIAGTIFNEAVFAATSSPGTTFASRVAASTPDLVDHVSFLQGYRAGGNEQVGLAPILASFKLDKGDSNASAYALRVRTGLADVTGLPSGGLRLPAPIWGYASYGFSGLVIWSLLSGVAIGWASCVLRRLLAEGSGRPRRCLNIVLAWVVFEGTGAVLGEFYFVERVGFVSFALAMYLCWMRRRELAGTKVPGSGQRVATTR